MNFKMGYKVKNNQRKKNETFILEGDWFVGLILKKKSFIQLAIGNKGPLLKMNLRQEF